MQHIHLSTGFALVLALFAIGLLGVIFAFVVAWRRETTARKRNETIAADTYIRSRVVPNDAAPATSRLGSTTAGAPLGGTTGGSYYPEPSRAAPYVAPAVIHSDNGMNGMMTGLLVGSMIAGQHDHTTVIHDSGPPADVAYGGGGGDSGFTYDSGSGSSSSSYDGGGSYDSGSSGGGSFGGC